jgi:hypothetical protein
MRAMDTRDQRRLSGEEEPVRPDEHYKEPGLFTWMQRNTSLLVRLFIVVTFTFGASTTAANFSYGLQGDPVRLSVEQLNRGELPPGVELNDYVEVVGTPDVPEDLQEKRIGLPESRVAVSSRYSTTYTYFGLKETGDNLLLQSIEAVPEPGTGERLWRGKLQTVGTAIFQDTTQSGLKTANLPHDESIPVVTTGDTPEYYREIFPAYAAIIGLWLLSIAWLIWKKNRPFIGM